MQRRDVVVVGAGLVGSLAAIFLARRGLAVEVFERRPDPRTTGGQGGRSINLVVAARGIHALERLGLWPAVRRLTVPVAGRMMHSVAGELTYQPYGRDRSECNYSVSRGELNRFLIERAEQHGVRVYFSRRLLAADFDRRTLEFDDGAGGARVEIVADRVLGADGAGSAVRAEMARLVGGFEESVEPLGWGYKELTIPPADGGAFRIDEHALHIWPRGNRMLMALPNRGGSFTVTLYLPDEEFAGLTDATAVRRLFERQFPDSLPLIHDLEGDFFDNPTGGLATVRCRPWHDGDRVALIGDAAHAIVPFFGQGMNCGFEDCRVLDELLDEHGNEDWGRVLAAYDTSRKPDGDAIAEMALDNFVEMRDRVGDPEFLLRKQVEHRLETEMPAEYRSRYSMVMYGAAIPYHVARQAGKLQHALLAELCDGLDDPSRLDLDRARSLVRERLTPFLQSRGVSLEY